MKLTKFTNDELNKIKETVNKSFSKSENKLDEANQAMKNAALVDKALELEREEYNIYSSEIDMSKLSVKLYQLIFDEEYLKSELYDEEQLNKIIDHSLLSHKLINVPRWGVIQWLHYKVIPYIYEHKYVNALDSYSDEIAETRIYKGETEHKHISHEYWHPETKVHDPKLYPKSVLPQGHVLEPYISPTKAIKSKTPLLDEKLKKSNQQYQIISDLIFHNIDEWSNIDFEYITDILYIINIEKLSKILQKWIYGYNYSVKTILNNSKELTDESLNPNIKPTDEAYDIIYNWFKNSLIKDLKEKTPLKGELEEQKLPENISEALSGNSTSKVKNEIITKSEITRCIFPLDLKWITKEEFDQLSKNNIISTIYTYINETALIKKEKFIDDLSEYTATHAHFICGRLHVQNNIYNNTLTWIQKSVITCIIKILLKKQQSNRIDISQITELKSKDLTIDVNSKLYQRMSTIVRSFYESFYDDSSMCLYYTYYILNLKGNHDFDYDFHILEDKLYTDFYNYGIFAILGEIIHFTDTFHIKAENITKSTNSTEIDKYMHFKLDYKITFDKEFEPLIKELSKCVGIDKKEIYKIIEFKIIEHDLSIKSSIKSNEFYIENRKERKIIKDIEFLYLIEKYFGYFTRPEYILKTAIRIFDIKRNKREQCFWSSSYGGDKWASIARTMLNRDKTKSKTIFVDTCWSLQHNTELFINKVYNENDPNSDISELKHLLTDIKNGFFKNVYKKAIHYNTKLDRFLYKSLIVEDIKELNESEKSYQSNLTEIEIYRKNDREYESEREQLPEKENIDLTNLNDREKEIIYEQINNDWGLKNAKIYVIKHEEPYPIVEILIEDAPFRWITDLESIIHYSDEHNLNLVTDEYEGISTLFK